jgi:hypothetical protein
MADETTPSNERIGVLRGLPAVDQSALPTVPGAYQALTSTDQTRLRRVAREHEAEVRQALEQYAARGDEARKDLGSNAPDPKHAAALAARLKNNKTARAKLEALITFLDDDNAVALNDTVLLLEEVRDFAEPNLKRNASISENYSETFEYFQIVGQKISEVLTRKKEKKEEK